MLIITSLLFGALLLQVGAVSVGLNDEDSIEQLSEEKISVVTDRITGGKNTSITKHPHMLSVHVNGKLKGGAALIGKEWAITTSFVVKKAAESPENVTVRAGSASAFAGGVTTVAKRIVIHPKQRGYENDVALIQLKNPFQPSKNVKAIKVGSTRPKTGGSVTFTGYGYYDDTQNKDEKYGVLKEVKLKFIDNRRCKPYYNTSLSFTKRSFCTLTTKTVSPEAADFGSALVYKKKLIGGFSGIPCGPIKPAVFSDLTQQRQWIRSTLKKYNTEELDEDSESEEEEGTNEIDDSQLSI